MVRTSYWTKVTDYFNTIKKKISRRSHFELNEKQDKNFVFQVIGTRYVPTFKQLKYLGKFYSDTETLITKLSFFLMLVSVLVLGAILYQQYIIQEPNTGGEYVEAVIGAPTYINPLFAQTNDIDQDLTRLIFSSLMRLDENGQITGDLAESFEIDEEQTTYTFTLKQNIQWHDGEPLTADDVLFTVGSIQDQNFKSPLYVTFRNVQVRKIDDRTVSFTLAEPFAPFISVMTFGILPEHRWQEIDPSHAILAELNLKPIGSGPYRFNSLVKDKKGNIKEYRLKRFKNYHRSGPFIDSISLKFFASNIEAQAALVDGNVDGFGFLPQSKQEILAEAEKFNTFSLPQYTALFFNQAANPVLSEKEVRFALALATSKYRIIDDIFSGVAEPVDAPILPGMVGYTQSISSTLFDPAQAEKLLDDAGWKRVYAETSDEPTEDSTSDVIDTTQGSTTLGLPNESAPIYTREKSITKNGKKELTTLEVTLTTIQRDEMIQVAETLRELWQSVGIKVNLQIVEIGKMQKDIIKPRGYEVLLFGQILGRDPDPYAFWHSSQSNDPGLNLALYSNKEVDELLEDARQTSNYEEREEKYIEFQQLLSEDVPAVFLYSLQYTYITPKNLKGITTQRINHPSDRFSNINSWFIKTKKSFNFFNFN